MKHTKETLINQLKQFYHQNQRVPSAHETVYLSNFPRYGVFEHHFGTWKKAVEAAGLSVAGNKSRRRRIEVSCAQCDKNFWVHPSSYTRSKTKRFFCNRSHAATYNNRHKDYGYVRSKFEMYVEERLTKDFPNTNFLFNSKDLIESELDIYVPSLRLAIELNGIVHYEPIYGKDKFTRIQNHDKQKMLRCHELGIELAVIDVQHCTTKQYNEYYQLIAELIR